MPMPKTQSIESMLKRDFSRAQKWLREMVELIPDLDPETDFNDYLDTNGMQRFAPETAEVLNAKMAETIELFEYHFATPEDDIYSFIIEHKMNNL